ncbi:MAG: efflux RND transporter periplasmic adaptor subunit [Verrucomicrobiia bacterium]
MKALATKKPLIGLLSACLLIGGAYWIWQQYATKSSDPVPVATARTPERPTTAVVTERDIHFAITAAGEIGPLDAVSVRPEIGGLISKLTLDIGDKVKKGNILFELDDKELQTEKTSRQTEIAGAQLAVETQRLLVEKAKLGFDRIRPMFANQLVSQEVFDNSRLDYELARNSLTIASNRLETARTTLQQVEDKLLKTVIRAPFDCTILARPVSVGQAISGASGYNSGTEVFTVANLADMIITAHVNQSDVTRVVVGQAVKVEVEAVAGLALTGRVDRIAPLATIKGGVKGFATRIRLQNAEELVRPGMTANLSIPLIAASNVLTVPLAAVFSDRGESYVYLQKSAAIFERQPVQVGRADYDFAEVTQGLKRGAVVSLVVPVAQEKDRPGNSIGMP